MNEFIIYYGWIGLVWVLLHEFSGLKMNNGRRIRLWLFWPITLTAWIIGFVNAWMHHKIK